MYAALVVYRVRLIPDSWSLGGWTFSPRPLYSLNPMVGVIEGFRSALPETNPMPWSMLVTTTGSAALIACTGIHYFRCQERLFADVA